jgi:hypothetical protein
MYQAEEGRSRFPVPTRQHLVYQGRFLVKRTPTDVKIAPA